MSQVRTIQTLQGKRYEIHAIADSDCRSWYDEILFATDDAAEAKKMARKLGTGEYYGTAIVDTVERVADCGTDDAGKMIIIKA